MAERLSSGPKRSRKPAERTAFAGYMGYLRGMAAPVAEIVSSRRIIDEIDHALIELLARRRAVVRELFAKKQALGLPLVDPVRETELLEERRAHALALGVSPEFVEAIFRKVLEDSHGIDVIDGGE